MCLPINKLKSQQNSGFFGRCADLWLGLDTGHMGADMYQEHTGMRDGRSMSGVATWNDHAEHGTLPAMNRIALQARVGDVARIIRKGTPIVEYGPTDLTMRLIEAVKSRTYVMVDSSAALLAFDRSRVERVEGCSVSSFVLDFFAEDNPAVIERPALGVFLGFTINNLPGPVPRAEPGDQLTRAFRSLLRTLPCGGNFLVAVDCNQNGEDVRRLYKEPWHCAFGVNFLYRIAAEFPTRGFDPEGFEYHPVWHEECRLLAHTVRAVKDQSFSMGEGPARIDVAVRKGDVFHYNNSFKYRPELFESCATQAELEIVECWEDVGSVRLYLFRIPPGRPAADPGVLFR